MSEVKQRLNTRLGFGGRSLAYGPTILAVTHISSLISPFMSRIVFGTYLLYILKEGCLWDK